MIPSAAGAAVLLVLLIAPLAHADEPPTIPVGYDAYRQWDKWYLQRIGARAYMRSTYDRAGGNEGADASHFLYQLADDKNVTLDIEGAGILYFARYNHWHGSPWHYIVDGNDTIVQETSTKDPTKPVADSVFEPHDAFPSPLAFTWSATRGADLSWVPIGFEKSFQMAYSRTHYGTGYYIFHQFVPGAKLSQPIKSWTSSDASPKDLLEHLQRLTDWKLDKRGEKRLDPLELPAHGAMSFMDLKGPSVVRLLSIELPASAASIAPKIRLQITWDHRKSPSVDAPLPLFFGAGTLFNRMHRELLVQSLPMSIKYSVKSITLSCRMPMPFFELAEA
ncbi:MAG TPA: DUF2961 domain-containing protein, partial [Tepidisphaeraceae bacterium]|nr:DUF2961 domain-containing protein [Tepidisphaeraceae bacterium]